ncbi:hypothetical protein RJ641_032254 [Dillenia turbinata]|uniref:Uncharacterized protein n=1 Tax=Dillenia turbinata TaxID=194707 RepID=A0AAN8ZI36_9MAGN
MDSLVCKTKAYFGEEEVKVKVEEERVQEEAVSSQLSIFKPRNASESLERDVVLRRIRHRKRVNKIRNAFQALVSSPFSSSSSSSNKPKWLDDAFAAP